MKTEFKKDQIVVNTKEMKGHVVFAEQGAIGIITHVFAGDCLVDFEPDRSHLSGDNCWYIAHGNLEILGEL